MKSRGERQQGMTLLEVMVALIIFAIGCIALVKTTGAQVRSLSVIETKNIALWVADNKLVLLQLEEQPPLLIWQQGTTKMAGETWYWRYRGRDTTNASLRAIEIEVRCAPEVGSASLSLIAYKELP